ncbi:MAG TPA: ABC transporter permease [Nocardioidaceae bacterium]|nr:ABC transporter permease [Nocardioidaceae bacterium]
MTAALRYELARIRTIRSTYWLSAIAFVFGIGLSFLAALGASISYATNQPPSAEDAATMGTAITTQFAVFGAPYFVAYILGMLGVFAWGHEYRHGMIRATLTALDSRTRAWIAKYVVVAGWVLLVALMTLVCSALIGWLWLHDDGVPFHVSDLAAIVGRTLLYTLVFTWIATAFTSLIRNQTAALVLMFLWPLALENVVTLILNVVPGLRDHADLTRFLPFTAGTRMISSIDRATSTFGEPLSLVGAVIVFGGLTAILMVASLVLFRSRDA